MCEFVHRVVMEMMVLLVKKEKRYRILKNDLDNFKQIFSFPLG